MVRRLASQPRAVSLAGRPGERATTPLDKALSVDGGNFVKVLVRPFESTDMQADIEGLLTAAFPKRPEYHNAEWYSTMWQWLETHPLGHLTHRWVLSRGNEVVGLISALPQYYRIGGQRVVAHTPGDYMVYPQYGFHALSLMRAFFGVCQNCVSVDQLEASVRIETWLGARAAGKLQYAAKLLDIPRSPASLPPAAQRLPKHLLRAVDEVLLLNGRKELQVEALSDFDPSFDDLFHTIAQMVPCLPEKDAAFLRWRYGPGCPQAPVTVLGVRGDDGLLGYAVLMVSPRGRDGYLLDLTVLPGRQDVARALLREAICIFRQAQAYILRYRFIESPTSPRARDLLRFGFFFRNDRCSTLLVKFADPALQHLASRSTRWSYSIGDGEGSYWVL